MIRGQQFRQGFNGIADPFAIRPLRVHGKDFHAFIYLMLAGGQEFALRRAFTPFLP